VDGGTRSGYVQAQLKPGRETPMTKRIFAAVIASAFLAAAIAPMASGQEKKPTAQQQKMKDCAAKWKDEKAKTGAKGREAYRTFMSGCLKT
jgi:Ni/Co efflux regulator RcnB